MDLNQELLLKAWEGSKRRLTTPNTGNKKAYCSWALNSSRKVALSAATYRSKATTKGSRFSMPRSIETLSWMRWHQMTSLTVPWLEEFRCRMSKTRSPKPPKSVLTVALYAWQVSAKTRVHSRNSSNRLSSVTCIAWCWHPKSKLWPKRSPSHSPSREYLKLSQMNSNGWLKKNWFNRKITSQVWLSHCKSSRTLWSNQRPNSVSAHLKAPTDNTLVLLNQQPHRAWAAPKVWVESGKETSRTFNSRSPTTKTRSSSCRCSRRSSTR